MRSGLVLAVIASLSLLSREAGACSLAFPQPGLPESERPRFVGRVTGYAEEANPVPGVEKAVSIRVDIDRPISGRVTKGPRTVVPLFLTAACGRVSYRYDDVLRLYPVGTRVAVVSTEKSPVSPDAPIIVDPLKEGGVQQFLAIGPRTSDGDLDFGRTDGRLYAYMLNFEFEGAVMALRAADRSQKFRRMLNLARYSGFHPWPANRMLLETLISESELSGEQAEAVLDVFQTSRSSPKP
jgi:hypothetical protein